MRKSIKKCCIAANKKNRYQQYRFCVSQNTFFQMAVENPPFSFPINRKTT